MANRFGLNPTGVRVLTVLASFFFGFGVLAYVILWMLIPQQAK